MLMICSNGALLKKYPGQDGVDLLAAVAALGPVVDVSGLGLQQIRDRIDQQDPGRNQPVCLVGGHDLVPTFVLPNPTLHAAKEVDGDVASDAPYGARPGRRGENFLPTRAVSRLPDCGVADAPGFLRLLQQAGTATATPHPDLHIAAQEFAGAAGTVRRVMPAASQALLSPPLPPAPGHLPPVDQLLNGRGRVHVLLHGTDKVDGRDTLWGHRAGAAEFVAAATAADIAMAGLRGAIVTFSSCYSAMLDVKSGTPRRTPDDQVALAALRAGAKAVFGCTRANWIDITDPFTAFGSALVAQVWVHLQQGHPAAEALRLAKWEFTRQSLRADAWTKPYVLKTVLQAQCYGHPMATL